MLQEKYICEKQEDGSYLAQSEITLSELARLTGISLPISVHYHTLAGYIMEKEENIPQVGTLIESDNWILKIENVNNHSINLVRVIKNNEF